MNQVSQYPLFPKFVVVFFLFLGICFANNSLSKSKISAGSRRSIKEGNRNYKKCRVSAVRKLKKGLVPPEEFKAIIRDCQERYPASSLYINCKKKTVLEFKGQVQKIKTKLARCRKLLSAVLFNSQKPLPLAIIDKKQYFAGIGFNHPISLKDLNMPNFDCSKLRTIFDDLNSAEYILFGNEPFVFTNFNKWKPQRFRKKFKLPRDIKKDGYYIKGLGKFFGKLKEKTGNLYFPSGRCVFKGALGRFFTGLSVYYLLDETKKQLIPYFSAAFYKPGLTLRRKRMAKKIMNVLKKGGAGSYKVTKKGKGSTFIAREPLQIFDEEGDPRNVCAKPRSHDMIVALKGRKDNSTFLDFLIVANIRNLCEFGDSRSSSF